MANKSGAIRAGRAYVEAFLESSLAERDLKKLQLKFRSFAATIAKIGAAFAVVGASILAPLTVATLKASELEETMNKFNVVFGDGAGSVKEWGDAFAAEVGRAKQQIADFLASSQDLFVPLGFDAATGEDLSKGITRLAVDVASFNNKLDADVLRDFHAALTGGGETVKKYGVIMNVAAEKAELLNMGIDPANATNAQKVMARYNILLRGTTAAQGDAVRSADSFANQTKALDAAMGDLAATVGTELLPIVTPYLKTLTGLIKATGEFIEEHPKLIAVAAGLGAVFLLVGGLLAVFATGALMLAGLAAAGVSFLGVGAALAVTLAVVLGTVTLLVAAWQALNAAYRMTDIAGVSDIDELNKSMERAIELNDELAERREKQKNRTIDAGGAIEDPSERATFFGDAAKEAEKELAGMQMQLEMQEQTVNSLAPTWMSLWQSGRATWKVEKAELIDKQKKLEQQKKTVKELTEQAAKAREEAANVGKRSEEANKGISDILDKLREAEATVGMDSMEKSIHELKKLGALENELSHARKIAARTAKAQADAEKKLSDQRAREQMKQDQLAAEDDIIGILNSLQGELFDAKSESRAIQSAIESGTDPEAALKLQQQQNDREKILVDLRRRSVEAGAADGGDREVDRARALLEQRDALLNANAEVQNRAMRFNAPLEVGSLDAMQAAIRAQGDQSPAAKTAKNTKDLLELEKKKARDKQSRQIVIGSPT